MLRDQLNPAMRKALNNVMQHCDREKLFNLQIYRTRFKAANVVVMCVKINLPK